MSNRVDIHKYEPKIYMYKGIEELADHKEIVKMSSSCYSGVQC